MRSLPTWKSRSMLGNSVKYEWATINQLLISCSFLSFRVIFINQFGSFTWEIFNIFLLIISSSFLKLFNCESSLVLVCTARISKSFSTLSFGWCLNPSNKKCQPATTVTSSPWENHLREGRGKCAHNALTFLFYFFLWIISWIFWIKISFFLFFFVTA